MERRMDNRDGTNQDSQQNGAAQAGSLEEQLAAARAEAEQYKDKYLREYAERENFRKRQERVMMDRVRFEKRTLVEKVLDVADNLERALRFEDSLDRAGLQQTLRMVVNQIDDVIRTEGLEAVPAVDRPFDPRVHEAIEMVKGTGKPEGTIVEEVRRGYVQGEETVRASRVKVAGGR
jgi:molecular chaperone GrpE